MKIKGGAAPIAPKVPVGAVLTIKRISLAENTPATEKSRAVVETVDPKNAKDGFTLCKPLDGKTAFDRELNYQCLPEEIVSISTSSTSTFIFIIT